MSIHDDIAKENNLNPEDVTSKMSVSTNTFSTTIATIPTQFNKIDDALDRLKARISAAADVLAPVLGPEGPPDPSKDVYDGPEMSPVAGQLQEVYDRLLQMGTRLSEIIDRVEV